MGTITGRDAGYNDEWEAPKVRCMVRGQGIKVDGK